jgi:serine/threonine protein kinase
MINDGKYKIADFGFSKKLDDEDRVGNYTVLGTRTTMAPEVKNRQKYGIKADVWSIGIIFYTMICSSIKYES